MGFLANLASPDLRYRVQGLLENHCIMNDRASIVQGWLSGLVPSLPPKSQCGRGCLSPQVEAETQPALTQNRQLESHENSRM